MTAVFLLAGMLLLAYWAYLDHQQKMAKQGVLPPAEFEALKERLEAMEAERARLRQRVENLEAIVTSEAYELEREARRALKSPPGRELPEGGAKPPLAIEEHEAAQDDEARAARLARRVRGG